MSYMYLHPPVHQFTTMEALRKPIKSDLASVLEMGIIAVQQVFQPQQTTFLFISSLYRGWYGLYTGA